MPALRLADLLASVSLLSDLGFALPAEESMRASVLGVALARRMGVAEEMVADVMYTALLQHVGCTGFAHETAGAYGDDLAFNAAAARTDANDVGDVLNTLVRATARGRRGSDWARVVGFTLLRGDDFGRRYATARCEVGRETARRLGLPDGVRRGLYEVAESWNGKSGLLGLRGEAISPVARIAAAAAIAVRFGSLGGPTMAAEALRRRAGRDLDPSVVAAFSEHGLKAMEEAAERDPRDQLLAAEPAPVRTVDSARLADVASAIGDVADLKSIYTLGHSSGVARLAAEAADRLGLDPPAATRVRVAALLHDLGRVGIPDSTWERGGPLTSAQWEQVRLHPYHTERILARSEVLAPMAVAAGMHHERLDGSGYHRGAAAREIGTEARILAAADAYQAMTQERPHRAAMAREAAAAELEREAADGRLDPDAAAAVLEADGHAARPTRPGPGPNGLSARETEVLRLVARGLSNREIADSLVVSRRTAEQQVQHIYTKIGSSSRAAAALFAMEHGLLD